MLAYMGQFEENIDSDYYDFVLKDEKAIDGYSEGLWYKNKRLMLNPARMELEYDWAVLKRDLKPDTLRAILGFFRRMECYNIPEFSDIPNNVSEV